MKSLQQEGTSALPGVVSEGGKVTGFRDPSVPPNNPLSILEAIKPMVRKADEIAAQEAAVATEDATPAAEALEPAPEMTDEASAALTDQIRELVHTPSPKSTAEAPEGVSPVATVETQVPTESEPRRRKRDKRREKGEPKVNSGTPSKPKTQEVRAPQFTRGIRPIAVKEERPVVPRPSGSIQLQKFLGLSGARHLTYIAKEIAGRGQKPEVVVYARSSSGYDIVRIAVVLYEVKGKDQVMEERSRLEIVEATGKFEGLVPHIGKTIFYGEVMGASKHGIPSDRAPRTQALNAVLLEANERLREAEERRKASAKAGKQARVSGQ